MRKFFYFKLMLNDSVCQLKYKGDYGVFYAYQAYDFILYYLFRFAFFRAIINF